MKIIAYVDTKEEAAEIRRIGRYADIGQHFRTLRD